MANKKTNAFDVFTKTGKIEDYIKYLRERGDSEVALDIVASNKQKVENANGEQTGRNKKTRNRHKDS